MPLTPVDVSARIAYFLLVAPLSIARFLQFANKRIPPEFVFFAVSWFILQGFWDVMLWKFARPAFGIDYEVEPLIWFRTGGR
jgi:hypothetical protein